MSGKTSSSSPEAPRGLRRELELFRRTLSLGVLAGITVFVVAMFGASAASAYWKATGTGSTTTTVATLAPPTNVTVPASSNSTVAVSWTASAGATAPTGYYVTRITGTTSMAACGTSPAAPVTGTSCTDSSVPEGTHKYIVTAVHRTWTAVSAASGNVTVDSWLNLVFDVEPANVAAGTSIPSIKVSLRLGQWTLPASNVPVTLSLAGNPGGGTLSGTPTAYTNSSGVATFSGLSINKAGTGYTLLASSSGYSGIISAPFNVTAAAASRLVIISPAPPAGAASVTANIGPITVQRQDAYGNPVSTGSTTVVLASSSTGTKTFAATAAGSAITAVTIPAASSSASFFYGDTKAGSPNIDVSSTGLSADVEPVTVTATMATKLAFGPTPIAAKKNAVITPAITVLVVDAFGNQTSSTTTVALASGCNIKGTLTATAAGGIATFADVQFNGNSNTDCTITASNADLTPATSNTFNAN